MNYCGLKAKMKIKCTLKSNHCHSCVFRNDTEFGTICNLPSRYWNKTLIITIQETKKKEGKMKRRES